MEQTGQVRLIAMQCYVFRGSNQPGTYLYTAREDDFSEVPEALLELMGGLVRVLSFRLDSQRKLANADAATVLQQLEQQGYYLQLPPDSGSGIRT